MFLALRQDGGGNRHFVGDVPLHCGDPLDAYLMGRWIEGRYEAAWGDGVLRGMICYGEDEARRVDERTLVRLPARTSRYDL